MGVIKTTEQTVQETIKALIAERKKIDSAVSKGNMALYALLGECLDLRIKCKTDSDYRELVEREFDRLKLKSQTNTPFETKVCKLVFGFADDRKKAAVYSKVLRVAVTENQVGKTLPAWISDNGGIEKIRSIPDPTAQAVYAARRATKLDSAKDSLKALDSIATIQQLPCGSKPGDVVVMLGVVDSNNAVKVVEFIDDQAGKLAEKLTISHESVASETSPPSVLKIGGKTSIQKVAESAQAAA